MGTRLVHHQLHALWIVLAIAWLQGCTGTSKVDSGLQAADADVSLTIKEQERECAPANGIGFSGIPTATPPGRPYPVYPPQMLLTGQEAVTAARCSVGTSGRLSDCRLIANRGSPLAGQALLTWLTTPGLQFAPIRPGKAPVATCHIWKIRFALGTRR